MARTISIKYRGAAKADRVSIKKTSTVKVEGAETVDIFAHKTEISSMEQKGDDLVIRFSDGVVTTLEGYFHCEAGAQPAMAVVDSDSRENLNVSFENGVCAAPVGTAQVLSYALTPAGEGAANAFLPAAGIGLAPLLGLGALAGGGAIAAGGGGGDGDGDTGGTGGGTGGTGGGTGGTGGGTGGTGGGTGGTGGGTGGTGGGTGGTGGTPTDQTPPPAPTIEPTNGTVIKGTAEPGSKVTLDLDGNGGPDVTVDVDGAGNWTHTPTTPSTDGTAVTGKATDAAGNTSPPTTVIVDASTPTPTIAGVNDDVGAITGNVANGGTTDDARPAVSGRGAEANATVAVFDGATQLGTTRADASGNWSFTPADALADGLHSFTVKATDALGNVSASSGAYAITIDSDGDGNGGGGGGDGDGDGDGDEVPDAPTITSVTDDVGSITGAVATGGVTDDSRPTIAGTGAQANGTVTVFDGATAIGTTTADGAGNWTLTPAAALADGAHNFTATAGTGAATSPASAAFAVRVDTAAPGAPLINSTDGRTVTGTAEPGSTVNLDVNGNGTVDTRVPTDGSGNWSYTPATPIPDGTTIRATASDPAGNTSGPASTVVDSDAPPSAPVITSVIDDVGTVGSPGTELEFAL